MNPELVTTIEVELRSHPHVVLLPEERGEALRKQVCDAFAFDDDFVWLWYNTGPNRTATAYELDDELTALRTALGPRVDAPLTLFITDDEVPPWICLQGIGTDLLRFIRELPCVEFFLVDEALENIVFDTHHDELIGYSRPRAR